MHSREDQSSLRGTIRYAIRISKHATTFTTAPTADAAKNGPFPNTGGYLCTLGSGGGDGHYG